MTPPTNTAAEGGVCSQCGERPGIWYVGDGRYICHGCHETLTWLQEVAMRVRSSSPAAREEER